MALRIPEDPPPIRINADGVALVGGTRVRLETVITAFHQGDSPEQIVDNYDALTLADVYATIAYYLFHREEVDAYIRRRFTLLNLPGTRKNLYAFQAGMATSPYIDASASI